MKLELLAKALRALLDEWYPPTDKGRQVKVTAAGLALLVALLASGQVYMLRAELAEVKVTTGRIWDSLVQAGIAKATPAAPQTAAAPTVTPPPAFASFRGPSLFPSAEGADAADGGNVPAAGAAGGAADASGRRVGKVTEER